MQKIRTAVIGLNMGKNHALAYHHSERSELVGVCDLDQSVAEEMANKYDCQSAVDYHKLLDQVDAVSICTPNFLHYRHAKEIIEAGKHVLIEKPMAFKESECLDLIESAKKNNVKLMVGYTVRFLPAFKFVQQLVQSGEYGSPFNMNVWVETFTRAEAGSWRTRIDAVGGGVLFSNGCHYVDLLLWVMGKIVWSEAIGTRNGTDWIEGEGSAHSIYKFESGALGYLETSWGMKYKNPNAKVHIHTPEALLVIDNNFEKVEAVHAEGRKILFEVPPMEIAGQQLDFMAKGVIAQNEHFLDCILTGNTPEVDGVEVLKSHRVLWDLQEKMNKHG